MSRKVIIGLVVIGVLLLACFVLGAASSGTAALHQVVDAQLDGLQVSLVDHVRVQDLALGQGSFPGCAVNVAEGVIVVPGFPGRCRLDVSDSRALAREVALRLDEGGSGIDVNLVLALENGKTATLGNAIGLDEAKTLRLPDGSYLLLENCLGGGFGQPCVVAVR